ncbi:MAG: response regulator, partial [Erysipelotrichia bacterium]|nr:response regulator [Erysipelotrichia bacterium]
MTKILLLEDDYLYRVSIKEFLQELDFHVDDFENGDDAFDAIFENSYDLLILDIRVPGMDGFSAIDVIQNQLGKKMPV